MVDAGLFDDVELTAWTKMPDNVIIGSNVTSINEAAFYYCSELKSVMIPNSVDSIGHQVFEGCSSLTSVMIPDSVASIGSSVFYGCIGLIYVVIPTKTMAQVQAMNYSSWSLGSGCKICCSDGIITIE